MHVHSAYDDATGLVLAGGASRRFGADKARFRVEGASMINRVVGAVTEVVEPVRISVGRDTEPFELEVEHIRDLTPNAGPLGGLQTGLRGADSLWLLVVACDLPFVTVAVLKSLLDARTFEADATVARTPDGRLHPHCACYHRRVLRIVDEQIERGELAFHRLLGRLSKVRIVDAPQAPLQNVNYREDVERPARP